MWKSFLPKIPFVILASAWLQAGPLNAQVSVAPTAVTYTIGAKDRGPGGETLEPKDDHPKPRDFFQGTGFAGILGERGQLAVSTKALRLGVYGTPACKTEDDETICTARIVYQFEVESQVIDAFNESVGALKQYILSDRGSPLTLRLPTSGIFGIGRANFNTKKGEVQQQPWSAGTLSASLRYIPVRSAENSIVSSASFSAQYSFEQHLWANVGGVDGTAFFVLTPSINVLAGKELRAQVSELESNISAIAGVSYQAGYQIGNSNAVSVSGTYSFTALRNGRRQISFGLTRVLGAVGTSR